MDIRNIAIIAHVDHGKTTLVDGLLKQSKTFRDNESYMEQDLIMDSNDQERERGITILAKNTAVMYKDVKINIVDTPGHADFGGEVERTLNMADGALLMVDAQEGPMPQTKFVLRKALELNLKIIVVINKIDKQNANINKTISRVSDLFLELASHEDQLNFTVLYAIGRDGKAWATLPADITADADLTPIFDAILRDVPAPCADLKAPLKMLVTSLDWDSYKGKYVIGRIQQGKVSSGEKIYLASLADKSQEAIVDAVYVNKGLGRVAVPEALAGDIVAFTGIKDASIGDTITSLVDRTPLPTMSIEDPTLSIYIGANTSPFRGQDGDFLTSRQLLDRIHKELQTNVAMKFEINENAQFIISGRGELHLSVFFETLRREGYEFEVGKPKVITKIIDGVEKEPFEELTIDVDNSYVGAINSELGKRRAVLKEQEPTDGGSTRLIFEIPTRQILGLRSTLLTLTKGTAVMNSLFLKYDKSNAVVQKMRKGVLIASAEGKAAAYGLQTAQEKGPVFIGPQEMVYEGMVVGVNGREQDLEINVCKGKQLTNVRSQGEDGIILTPPTIMSLEQYLNFLEDDELLEITPKNIRLRKKILNTAQRLKSIRR